MKYCAVLVLLCTSLSINAQPSHALPENEVLMAARCSAMADFVLEHPGLAQAVLLRQTALMTRVAVSLVVPRDGTPLEADPLFTKEKRATLSGLREMSPSADKLTLSARYLDCSSWKSRVIDDMAARPRPNAAPP